MTIISYAQGVSQITSSALSRLAITEDPRPLVKSTVDLCIKQLSKLSNELSFPYDRVQTETK